jgi:hypothetical protein
VLAAHPPRLTAPAVYEPRYRELFRTQQQQQQQQQQASQQQPGPAGGAPPQFGHILAGSAAPPVMMEAAVGGLPPLGVAAAVKGIEELPNGQLQVRVSAWAPAVTHMLLCRRAWSTAYPAAVHAHAHAPRKP